MVNLDIRKLKELKEKMDGLVYPTSEQVAEYLDIADYTGHTDYDIVNEQYVLDSLVKEGSVYAIKCRLEDVNNAYFNDFYEIQGDGNYTDVTVSSLNDKIDDDLTGEGYVKDMFLYELSNHEYDITGDLTETFDALELTAKKVKDSKKLRHGLELALKDYIKEVENY